MAARKKGEPPNQSKAAKKRQYAKRTPQARANQKKTQAYSRPGKITEAGVGNIPVAVARAAMTIAKFASKNKSSAKTKPKTSKPKTMSASEYGKTLREDRAAQAAYKARQRAVPAAEAKANAAKAKSGAAAAKRITKRAAQENNKGSTLRYNIKYGKR